MKKKAVLYFFVFSCCTCCLYAQSSWDRLIQKENGKERLVINGKKGKLYDNIKYIKCSTDSIRTAYIAKKDGKILMVLDTFENEYQRIEENSIRFSPNGARIVFLAKNDDKWYVIVDGKPQTQIKDPSAFNEALFNLQFSADENRLSYVVSKDVSPGSASNTGWGVVTDGKEDGHLFASILYNRFSPDGMHSLYVGKKENGKWIVIVDGVEDKIEMDDFKNFTPIFSPDSKHVVYGAKIKDQWFMVFDGTISGKLACTNVGFPVFNQTCDSVGYLGLINRKWHLIVNNEIIENYEVKPDDLDSFLMIKPLEYYFSLDSDRQCPMLINLLKAGSGLVRKVNTYTMIYPTGFFNRDEYGKSKLEIGMNYITVSYKIKTIHLETIFSDLEDRNIDFYFNALPGHLYALKTNSSEKEFVTCKYLGEKYLGIVDITNLSVNHEPAEKRSK